MTWSVFNQLGSIGQKKVNPLPVIEPVCGPEDVHVFGSHSDLCLYCGISPGWFSKHEGKVCNARIALRKAEKEQKTEKEQQAAVSKAKLAQLKAQLPFINAVKSCAHVIEKNGCVKCKATVAEIESALASLTCNHSWIGADDGSAIICLKCGTAKPEPIDPMPAQPYIDYVKLAKSQEKPKPLDRPTGRKFR